MVIDIEKDTVCKIQTAMNFAMNKQQMVEVLKLINNYRNVKRDIKGYQLLKGKWIKKFYNL